MKKLLKFIGIVVFLLIVAVVAVVASTFMGRTSIVDGFQSGLVRVIKDGMVSVSLLDTGDGNVALVDAGNDSSGKAILAELSRFGLAPDAVKTILLTHGHPDHIAAISIFPKAEVLALQGELPLLEGRTAGNGPLHWVISARPAGIKVSRALNDGDTIQIGQLAVRVFAVPGHTAGSAAYLAGGVLIMGDSADISSGGALKGSPWLFSDSQSQNRASLAALQQRLLKEGVEVKTLVFSHSGAVSQGLAPLAAFAAQQ